MRDAGRAYVNCFLLLRGGLGFSSGSGVDLNGVLVVFCVLMAFRDFGFNKILGSRVFYIAVAEASSQH